MKKKIINRLCIGPKNDNIVINVFAALKPTRLRKCVQYGINYANSFMINKQAQTPLY